MGPYMHSISFHGDVTFLGQVPVEHQFAMPQVVQHWPKVCGVSVNEIGTGFILEKSRNREQPRSAECQKHFHCNKKEIRRKVLHTKYFGRAGIKIKHLTQKKKIC